MELRLTDNEHELLRQTLLEQHRHLLHEIAKAHHHAFKTELRHRCATLEGIMEKLNAEVPELAMQETG